MTPRERLFALEQFGIKLGLDNITAILDALGRPDRTFASVHVAGTNGKGSVTAMVERGLRAAGHRTGRYTSPHLAAIEERIALDGVPVDAATFDDATARVLALIDDLVDARALPHLPTFFEATTAIAFEIFNRAAVSAAAVEVGLGGRFDATNVITPHVTAITSIDRDHERHLGSTLQQIAFEKAGIIKPETPVVVGQMAPEPHLVIEQVARAKHAPLVDAVPAARGTPVALALNGEHQHSNAAVAVEVLKLCQFPAPGATTTVAVDREAILRALTDVEWPARLEWLRLAGGGDVLLDAAHNPAGARALAGYVLSTTGPLPLIIGVLSDKDVAAILHELKPAASRFAAVTVESPRAMPAGELAALIARLFPGMPCDKYEHPDAAVAALCRADARAVIAGSIFLVGPIRARLLAHGATPVRYPAKACPFLLD